MANRPPPGDDQTQQGQEYIYGGFNNGALVWTRNNVQVLKQKQGDTAFVNTVIQRRAAPPSSASASSSSAASSSATATPGAPGKETKASRFRVRFQDARPHAAAKPSDRRKQGDAARSEARETDRLAVRRKSPAQQHHQQHHQQHQGKQQQAGNQQHQIQQQQTPSPLVAPAQRVLGAEGAGTGEASTVGIPPSLSGWILHDVPFDISAGDKAALRFYLDVLPRRTYPFEAWHILTFNPLRSRDMYEKLFSDEMVLRCAISVGAVYEASCHGVETIPVMHHYARLCRYIVDLLQQPSLNPRKHVLIQAISTLALLAHWSDRDDLWHVHMNGLQQFIQSTGGVDALTPEMKWIAYKADITGSAEKAIDACLPVGHRQHSSVMDMIDEAKRREVAAIFHRWVRPCCTDDKMLDIFVSATLFMIAVFHVRETGTGQFHPDAMMEDRYHMAYLIQNYPTPIGAAPAIDDSAAAAAASPSSSGSSSAASTASEVAALFKGVETAMRLAISLYGKEIVHDPWDRAGDLSATLGLMAKHLRAVTTALREAKRDMMAAASSSYSSSSSSYPSSPQPSLPGGVMPGLVVVEAVRPLLLFLVVLGWMVSESRRLRGARACDDAAVFADLLVEMVGSSEAHLADRVPDEYWAICRLADFRNIRGREWDLHRTVGRMMDEWRSRGHV